MLLAWRRFPCGFESLKTLHAMGSGTGMASGFAKLGRFGFDQPIFSVCGDSTFFHAVMPALVNAIHNDADITMVVLDNRGTAMTGFQAHPGLETERIRGSGSGCGHTARCARPWGPRSGSATPLIWRIRKRTSLKCSMIPKG